MSAVAPDLPPELGQLAGPPPGMPPSIQIPGGPPPGVGLPPGADPFAGVLEEDDEVEVLDAIRQLLVHYIDIASDEVEKAEVAKCLQIVQKLFASNQQAAEAGQGTTPAMKGMRQAIEARA